MPWSHVSGPIEALKWYVAHVVPGDLLDCGSIDLIKRVIAVGGDTVEVRNNKVYINGEAAPDPDAHYDPNTHTQRDSYGPEMVPAGKFFVMGDNRDESYDSRYWGFADEGDVKGQATFIYWSWNSKARWADIIRWMRSVCRRRWRAACSR